MKKADIFLQIISELTGIAIADDPDLIRILYQHIPPDGNLQEELTDAEARIWLGELRADKKAVLNWLGQGFFRALYRHADPTGEG